MRRGLQERDKGGGWIGPGNNEAQSSKKGVEVRRVEKGRVEAHLSVEVVVAQLENKSNEAQQVAERPHSGRGTMEEDEGFEMRSMPDDEEELETDSEWLEEDRGSLPEELDFLRCLELNCCREVGYQGVQRDGANLMFEMEEFREATWVACSKEMEGTGEVQSQTLVIRDQWTHSIPVDCGLLVVVWPEVQSYSSGEHT
ncbi:hypothetical protein F0562_005660 [Nyssa sinensis]|uniref:Uncharacterized protein n=1 Tax=Nyssa sinensis TaxID=561372 RepID=A0A5J5AL52_9ASTE|nr:hypothetical protein F0562_005660 [Nyssa sinensis]